MSEIGIRSGHVALVEIRETAEQFFDIPLIQEIAGAFESFDDDIDIRAVVRRRKARHFAPVPISAMVQCLTRRAAVPTSRVRASRHFTLRGTDEVSYQKTN